MIDEIHVENVALIRDATLVPAEGLTVVTGETGSGKTALLSALKLLCGERADVSTIREGADGLVCEGRFFKDEDELIAVRKLGQDGRSRVSINGSMASVSELSSQVGTSVDLCGQHEHQRLLKATSHLEMLDSWAGDDVASALSLYQEAFSAAHDAQKELERIQEARQSSSVQLDEARFILQRIDEVNPQEGEYDDLLSMLSKMENSESLARAADTVHQSLSSDQGAIDAIQQAASALDAVAQIDEQLAQFANDLRETTYVLEDIARESVNYRDSIEYDEESLVRNQERMAAMQNLMRLYGPRMEDVIQKRNDAAELVSLVDNSAAHEKAAKKRLEEAEQGLQKAATDLIERRSDVAPRFTSAINAQLERLEMSGASILCDMTELKREKWTKQGPSKVEFMFCPAEGMNPRPLSRIASGGEISRVMLAIKVVLGETDSVDTLIFDEVDAGVGGATAVALADVIADLAKTHQVIVVTHLPQVAIKGDTHYHVTKETTEQLPETRLNLLQNDDRIEEIARMLSGKVTETSLKHARELLAS